MSHRCRGPRHSFFFNDPATTEIYTLSLHDALPISSPALEPAVVEVTVEPSALRVQADILQGDQPLNLADRKSTRLNSSHVRISYAVFCLKKKTPTSPTPPPAAARSDRRLGPWPSSL